MLYEQRHCKFKVRGLANIICLNEFSNLSRREETQTFEDEG